MRAGRRRGLASSNPPPIFFRPACGDQPLSTRPSTSRALALREARRTPMTTSSLTLASGRCCAAGRPLCNALGQLLVLQHRLFSSRRLQYRPVSGRTLHATASAIYIASSPVVAKAHHSSPTTGVGSNPPSFEKAGAQSERDPRSLSMSSDHARQRAVYPRRAVCLRNRASAEPSPVWPANSPMVGVVGAAVHWICLCVGIPIS